MKELGGYFELEVGHGEAFHKDALALNSARNCLRYILQAQKPTKIYLPAYCCDSLIEPLQSEGVPYTFYHLDRQFEISEKPKLKTTEKLLYINYFSLKSDYVAELHQRYSSQLIVDNSQAFYEPPLPDVDTFYSPRKFFGVSDGGYLYTGHPLEKGQGVLEQDVSRGRVEHLVGRMEQDASSYYSIYRGSERGLIDQPIKNMSELTKAVLSSIDYKSIALKRQRNFWALHSVLASSSYFKVKLLNDFVPMIYPFFTKDVRLRDALIAKKIYVASYWDEAEQRSGTIEKNFINNLLPLPIDQRVNMADLVRISNLLAMRD